jgi:hypothetical protein
MLVISEIINVFNNRRINLQNKKAISHSKIAKALRKHNLCNGNNILKLLSSLPEETANSGSGAQPSALDLPDSEDSDDSLRLPPLLLCSERLTEAARDPEDSLRSPLCWDSCLVEAAEAAAVRTESLEMVEDTREDCRSGLADSSEMSEMSSLACSPIHKRGVEM